jgi:hypothetical protein
LLDKWRLLIALPLACTLLSGCISAKSFVDPAFPKVAYSDVRSRPVPLKLRLLVEFQRNGVPLPKADANLRDNADRILRATGVIAPVLDDGEGQIKVVVNNIGDTGNAVAKGVGTGLTFGLVGNTVSDAYEMTVTITAKGRTITRTGVRHALYTAVGNASIPPNLETAPPVVIYQRVLEQMLLRTLQDMQHSGELATLNLPARCATAACASALI